ncbi:MAG: plasmid stabilization protein [Candidatus Marinimicrobia bacterium]|nr:plasmid stabilization protein [Candidatus Neomarinimicrobiota bacterium]MCK9484975.1 plasmid stabilization protein [Candidatus Neomarinimicrobiota bacterium]MCK9560349.1 plasmid stabilization protein [Candidatus Neomarinimicrobiota bacterium]MDD5062401.1 plasmid stabilization protein [Candidatus Neomarinimicrobiota bacterium]MDD5230307.1 plasmid stabilization protein [Candidatus Neomarinimicrobiota bacterium]
MNYKICYTKSYNRLAARFIRFHPELEEQYRKTLQLLELNPFHKSLRLHAIKGQFDNLYSVSINLKYRLLIILIIKEKTIIPVNIGSYDQVY